MNYEQLKTIDTPEDMHTVLFNMTKDDALAALRESPPDEERTTLDFWICTALASYILSTYQTRWDRP